MSRAKPRPRRLELETLPEPAFATGGMVPGPVVFRVDGGCIPSSRPLPIRVARIEDEAAEPLRLPPLRRVVMREWRCTNLHPKFGDRGQRCNRVLWRGAVAPNQQVYCDRCRDLRDLTDDPGVVVVFGSTAITQSEAV